MKTKDNLLGTYVVEGEEYAGRTSMKFTSEDIGLDAPCKTFLLSGNEAIARGAVEAGVKVASSYPGSPVTYVLENLAFAAKLYPSIHVEWSTNEKCAYEVALGAAIAGVRAMTSLKNVGMHWLLDPLFSSCASGPRGLVIVVADDPGGEATKHEPDTRYMAMYTEIPVLEPSSLQEMKDFIPLAFDLSEELWVPVIVRLTYRLGYSREAVTFGAIRHETREREAHFDRDMETTYRWCSVKALPFPHKPGPARHTRFHGELPNGLEALMGKLPKASLIQEKIDALPQNELTVPDRAKIGVISSGLAYRTAMEALDLVGASDVAVLKLTCAYPLPRPLIDRLLNSVEALLVVEEIEPFIENQVRSRAAGLRQPPTILGKLTGDVAYSHELEREDIARALARLLGMARIPVASLERRRVAEQMLRDEVQVDTVQRLCPGCPEFAALYALKRVMHDLGLDDKAIVTGDDGCHAVSSNEPLAVEQIISCMGASIGIANGLAQSGLPDKIVAVIGDSTFFHAGIPELVNAVYNKANILVLVLDNRTTAMTGHQPHPGGFGITAANERTKTLYIEDFARAAKADHVAVVNPYNFQETYQALEQGLTNGGVSVVVSRRVCALVAQRQGKRRVLSDSRSRIVKERCTSWQDGSCSICLNDFGCPAMIAAPNAALGIRSPEIDPEICVGCKVCRQICPLSAIEEMKGLEDD